MHKIGGAHCQCVNNYYAKFKYKRMNTIGATDYTNQAPPKHLGRKKISKFKISSEMEKYLLNVHKIESAHL